jgi:hypothetical protein
MTAWRRLEGRMSSVVKLSDVIEALEYPEEWQCYLDRNSGKIITVTDNEASNVDDDQDAEEFEDLPGWQQDSIRDVKRDLEGADLIELPSKFVVHEWDIMRRFSLAQGDPAGSELLDAIHGTGAFRMFRATTERHGLREAWFSYRARALEKVARRWLEENGIEFSED